MTNPARGYSERLAACLDRLRDLRRVAEDALTGGWGLFQSHADHDAVAFMRAVIPNVAAVEILGRADVQLVVPATAAGRAAFECALTARWMVWPSDLAERDRRWFSLFADERAYWTRMRVEADARQDPPEIVAGLDAELERVNTLLDEVTSQLGAAGAKSPGRLPTMDSMLEETGLGRHYVVYKTACQLVHPATRALNLVRAQADHGDEAEIATFEYRARPRDWVPAISLAAEALSSGLETLSGRVGPAIGLDGQAELFNAVVRSLRAMTALKEYPDSGDRPPLRRQQ